MVQTTINPPQRSQAMHKQNKTAELTTPLISFNLEGHLVDVYHLDIDINVGRLKKIQRDLGGIPNQEAFDLICKYRAQVPPEVWSTIGEQPIILPGCKNLKEGYCLVVTVDAEQCIFKTQESGLLNGFLIAAYRLAS